ncbi:hypothetical protein [Nannocystis radixulma]|uniref:Uncharacterized protein n=1 Tax=Nannocystis radixulma TaxID=2995305 RepID=A0ABT5BH04_9BACT|nr:hypothetical protein [Nannocystis radixulma]MDC0672978.1 hypothetical protein [Nannocystis radixulma]
MDNLVNLTRFAATAMPSMDRHGHSTPSSGGIAGANRPGALW